jgi:hypothetical protein
MIPKNNGRYKINRKIIRLLIEKKNLLLTTLCARRDHLNY